MEHSTRAHARLAPSASHYWLNCAASISLSEHVPQAPSKVAAEGTAAHELAEKCLKEGKPAKEYVGEEIAIEEWVFPVDVLMAEHVQVYVDYVNLQISTMELCGGDFQYMVEESVSIPATGEHGTCDFMACDFLNKKLLVCDLKYGQGVEVEVEENTQLLLYANGAMQRLKPEIAEQIETIELVVVQPRCFKNGKAIRSWECDIKTYDKWIKKLTAAAKKANGKNPKAKAGEWCRYCSAAPLCTAYEKRSLQVVSEDFSMDTVGNEGPVLEAPELMSIDRIASLLPHLATLQGWCKNVEKFASEQAHKGVPIPGYKIVATRATRKWINESDAALALSLMGIDDEDLYTEPQLRSVAQLEKVVGKKHVKDLEKLIEKRSGGTVLVPESDKRPPVLAEAAEDFAGLIG